MSEREQFLARTASEIHDDFPTCKSTIAAYFHCIVVNERAGHNGDAVQKICRPHKRQMNWCMVTSFCPAENDMFVHCLNQSQGMRTDGNTINVPDMEHVPARCQPTFQRLDQCLVERTQQFAANKR